MLCRARRRLPRPRRTASPPQIARALPDDTVVIDCGADHRLTDAGRLGPGSTAASTPAPGPTGCPSSPRPAGARSPASTRIAVPGCNPTVVHAGAGAGRSPPGSSTPAGIVVVAASGTSGAGKAPKATPARLAR